MEGLIFLGVIGVAFAISKVREDRQGTPGRSGDFDDRWLAAGKELELSTRVASVSTMRGKVDGHSVKVTSNRGAEPVIDVRFYSGLRDFDIEPRLKRTSAKAETSIGQPEFEARFRLDFGPSEDDHQRAQLWLNDARREILTVLDDALVIDEIEEDELEVRMPRTDWRASELVQAVRLCVLVAQTLDQSFQATPQDTVRPTPQDTVRPTPQDAVRPPEEST